MKITDKPHWHHECAERVLGLQERTRTNDNELRRTDCSYPLQLRQKSALKPHAADGQFRG
jgi:hypothetical protein